jgi:MbtH protein
MTNKIQQKSAQKNEHINRFCVVVNSEEQYSYWFADSRLPAGWKSTGFIGSREECLTEVENIWTDMRPLSIRKEVVNKAIDTGAT